MAPIQHQQIGEGEAFVEPISADTAKGLLAAAEELELDPGVVRTQLGGFLAPAEVVEKWQEGDTGDAQVTTPEDAAQAAADANAEAADDGRPAASASKADWEAYAVDNGYDADEGLTKAQLIERYGASE
jgi:hypothetical protein